MLELNGLVMSGFLITVRLKVRKPHYEASLLHFLNLHYMLNLVILLIQLTVFHLQRSWGWAACY